MPVILWLLGVPLSVVLLLVGFIAANLPFLSERLLLVVSLVFSPL